MQSYTPTDIMLARIQTLISLGYDREEAASVVAETYSPFRQVDAALGVGPECCANLQAESTSRCHGSFDGEARRLVRASSKLIEVRPPVR